VPEDDAPEELQSLLLMPIYQVFGCDGGGNIESSILVGGHSDLSVVNFLGPGDGWHPHLSCQDRTSQQLSNPGQPYPTAKICPEVGHCIVKLVQFCLFVLDSEAHVSKMLGHVALPLEELLRESQQHLPRAFQFTVRAEEAGVHPDHPGLLGGVEEVHKLEELLQGKPVQRFLVAIPVAVWDRGMGPFGQNFGITQESGDQES